MKRITKDKVKRNFNEYINSNKSVIYFLIGNKKKARYFYRKAGGWYEGKYIGLIK